MESSELKMILEGALLAAGRPLSLRELANLFDPMGQPGNDELRVALAELAEECETRAYELKEVGSGFRFQVKNKYGLWVSRLWEEKPPRYSRALLETLALVAYKQPLTRGEIEDVRGVAVSTNIIRTLLERGWVRVVGHRDAPGKPAMYATTREFLDYFNLKNLNQLPSLADIKDIAAVNQELELEEPPAEGRSIELPEEDLHGSEVAANDAIEHDDVISKEQLDALVDHAEAIVAGDEDVPADVSDAEPETDKLNVNADWSSSEDTGDVNFVAQAIPIAGSAEAIAEASEVEPLTEEEKFVEAAVAQENLKVDESVVPEPNDVDPDANFDSLPN